MSDDIKKWADRLAEDFVAAGEKEYGMPDPIDAIVRKLCGQSVHQGGFAVAGCRCSEIRAALEQAREQDQLTRTVQAETEIGMLAGVLLEEFGGPVTSESACEMAVRVLREQGAEIERLRAERDRFYKQLVVMEADAERLAGVLANVLALGSVPLTASLRSVVHAALAAHEEASRERV